MGTADGPEAQERGAGDCARATDSGCGAADPATTAAATASQARAFPMLSPVPTIPPTICGAGITGKARVRTSAPKMSVFVAGRRETKGVANLTHCGGGAAWAMLPLFGH